MGAERQVSPKDRWPIPFSKVCGFISIMSIQNGLSAAFPARYAYGMPEAPTAPPMHGIHTLLAYHVSMSIPKLAFLLRAYIFSSQSCRQVTLE